MLLRPSLICFKVPLINYMYVFFSDLKKSGLIYFYSFVKIKIQHFYTPKKCLISF